MLSDKDFIFHIYITRGKTLNKVKVICQGQGQISRSQFSEKWPLSGHSCFTNASCYPCFTTKRCDCVNLVCDVGLIRICNI